MGLNLFQRVFSTKEGLNAAADRESADAAVHRRRQAQYQPLMWRSADRWGILAGNEMRAAEKLEEQAGASRRAAGVPWLQRALGRF